MTKMDSVPTPMVSRESTRGWYFFFFHREKKNRKKKENKAFQSLTPRKLGQPEKVFSSCDSDVVARPQHGRNRGTVHATLWLVTSLTPVPDFDPSVLADYWPLCISVFQCPLSIPLSSVTIVCPRTVDVFSSLILLDGLLMRRFGEIKW